jgi:DNA-binding response OmpR family regulator
MANVLLVEDDPWIADCYTQWLAAGGHAVRVSRDCQAALDAVDESQPDVIILDLLLPHANGVQLLHALQSHGDLAGIPVILCSSSLPDGLPDLTAYGVRRAVTKASLTPGGLRAEVREVLANAAI